MKRGGILHPGLSRVIASLGHGDALVIADAGLPIPAEVERVDLAFAPGKPPLMDVLEAVLAEMEVERAILAEEARTQAPPRFYRDLVERLSGLPKVGQNLEYLPHQEFKARLGGVKAVVRTGEFTPYANIILLCGVVF